VAGLSSLGEKGLFSKVLEDIGRDWPASRTHGIRIAMFDWGVIVSNARFLLVQGFLGIGTYGGGTLKLAIPAMVLGFTLGVLAALARMAERPWLHYPAVVYIEGIRGMPLVMVIFWFYFFIPLLSGARPPE